VLEVVEVDRQVLLGLLVLVAVVFLGLKLDMVVVLVFPVWVLQVLGLPGLVRLVALGLLALVVEVGVRQML